MASYNIDENVKLTYVTHNYFSSTNLSKYFKLQYNDDSELDFILIFENEHKLRNKIYYSNIYCYISSLKTHETKMHNGYALKLLSVLIDLCKQNNIQTIKLEDMTDNYKQENNIYSKLGFNYVCDNNPEMILKL